MTHPKVTPKGFIKACMAIIMVAFLKGRLAVLKEIPKVIASAHL